MTRPFTWAEDGRLTVFRGAEVAAEFDVPELADDDAHAAAPAFDRVAWATPGETVCASAKGEVLWSRRHPSAAETASLAFAVGGGTLWVYLGTADDDPDGDDHWLAYDATTGALRSHYRVGGGAGQGMVLPVAGADRALLAYSEGSVGELYLGGPGVALRAYAIGERGLLDVAPDGSEFLTVDPAGVAFHDVATGAVRLTVRGEFAWAGGYLDADTVVVVDEEYRTLDPRTGSDVGRLMMTPEYAEDLVLLGDGTYLIPGPDGRPRRI